MEVVDRHQQATDRIPVPIVGVTHGLIRNRDKAHVGSIWLHRTTEYEAEDPTTGERHASPVARDVVLVVIRARGRRSAGCGSPPRS